MAISYTPGPGDAALLPGERQHILSQIRDSRAAKFCLTFNQGNCSFQTNCYRVIRIDATNAEIRVVGTGVLVGTLTVS